MSEGFNSENESTIDIPIVNILIFLTILLILITPSMLKLNKFLFIIGFIIAILLMNLLLTFFKVLYYDNSWYTQEYKYNNSNIYKEAINDVYNDTKTGFYYYIDVAYHSFFSSLTYNNIKDNTKYVCGSIFQYIFKPIGKGIKYIFYGKPKADYNTTRTKYTKIHY